MGWLWPSGAYQGCQRGAARFATRDGDATSLPRARSGQSRPYMSAAALDVGALAGMGSNLAGQAQGLSDQGAYPFPGYIPSSGL